MSEILQTQPIVKLYENEYNNLDLDEVLEHHGIKGQKHGVRNGPPYPLDSRISTGKRLKKTVGSIKRKLSSKSAVKKAKKAKQSTPQDKYQNKEDAIKAKDIEYINQNKGSFSTKEMNDVMNRITTEERLSKMVYDQKKAKRLTSNKAFRVVASSAISGFTFAAVNYAMANKQSRENYGNKFIKDMAIGASVGAMTQILPESAKGDIYRLKGNRR